MILPKLTRAAIYLAKGQEVEIPWPDLAMPPVAHHTYTIQARHRDAGQHSLEVLRVIELPEDKFRAVVRLAETTRPLRIKATVRPDPSQPMNTVEEHTETEPEQVDAAYQRLLSDDARRRNLRLREPHLARGAERRKVEEAERDIEAARAKGEPTKLAEGRRDRALRRLGALEADEAA